MPIRADTPGVVAAPLWLTHRRIRLRIISAVIGIASLLTGCGGGLGGDNNQDPLAEVYWQYDQSATQTMQCHFIFNSSVGWTGANLADFVIQHQIRCTGTAIPSQMVIQISTELIHSGATVKSWGAGPSATSGLGYSQNYECTAACTGIWTVYFYWYITPNVVGAWSGPNYLTSDVGDFTCGPFSPTLQCTGTQNYTKVGT